MKVRVTVDVPNARYYEMVKGIIFFGAWLGSVVTLKHLRSTFVQRELLEER